METDGTRGSHLLVIVVKPKVVRTVGAKVGLLTVEIIVPHFECLGEGLLRYTKQIYIIITPF